MALQESRFLPAMMQKNSMQTVQQQLLRAKSCVMKVVTSVQENAEDIYAEAQQINEEREAKKAVVEDEEVTEADCRNRRDCRDSRRLYRRIKRKTHTRTVLFNEIYNQT